MSTENKINAQFVAAPVAIIERFGLITAALYGLIWSKCQLSRKVCYASETSLGNELGYTRQTIGKKIRVLEDAGLISVITHNRQPSDRRGFLLYITCNDEKLRMLEEEVRKEKKTYGFIPRDFSSPEWQY